MNEIVLTYEQYMGTICGAGGVLVLLSLLMAMFLDRALRAERRLQAYRRMIERRTEWETTKY